MTETSAPAVLTSSQALSGLRTVRQVLAPDLNDEELKLFAMVAARSGLDPFARQVYAIKRGGRVTFQTSIDGYRSIAARTGRYDGQDEPEYGPTIDTPWAHPEYATVRVYRKDMSRPVAATARWDEYCPEGGAAQMWRRMPFLMLAKVAEALALRKAFPYDPERREGIGADLYTADEMAQAERQAATAPRQPDPSIHERVAVRRQQFAPVTAATEPPIDGEFIEAPDTQQATGGSDDSPAAPSPSAAVVSPSAAAAEPSTATCGDEDASPMALGLCTKAPHKTGSHGNANGTWPGAK